MSSLTERLRDESWRFAKFPPTATELQAWHEACCQAADEIARLGAELKAEKHEVEEWKRCVSDKQVMQRAAEISRLRNTAAAVLKAWDTRRATTYSTDLNPAMDDLRNAAGIVAPFDPTDPPPGPFDVTYRDGLELPDENRS